MIAERHLSNNYLHHKYARYLKIDRMEYLYSLFNQRKKVIDLITKQIHLLQIVEPINWWFCRVFPNVKQLDLNLRHSQIMITIIDNLLHIEEAIYFDFLML